MQDWLHALLPIPATSDRNATIAMPVRDNFMEILPGYRLGMFAQEACRCCSWKITDGTK